MKVFRIPYIIDVCGRSISTIPRWVAVEYEGWYFIVYHQFSVSTILQTITLFSKLLYSQLLLFMLPNKSWAFLVPPNSEGIRRKPRLPWLYPMETFGCYDFYPRQHAKLYHATFPTTSWSADILLFFFITITLIFFPSPHILGSSNLRNTPMIQVLTRFHLDILHFSFAVFLEKQLQYRTKIRKNIE